MTIPGAVLADAMNLENGLQYEVYDDDIVITGYDKFAGNEVVIPETIEGLPVTSIGENVFWVCTSVTSVEIPDSVKNIGKYEFSGCFSLTAITVPYDLEKIEIGTFFGCRSLTSITIPDSVTNIEQDAFLDCSSLESIMIQNPECEIDDNANTISNTAVIYGYPGSAAQAYAEKYDREFVALDENQDTTDPGILWGDANDDGKVDISDVVLMNRVYVGVDEISAEGLTNADVDQSGKIELSDSMNILRLLVHLLTPEDFPIQAE
ncbi:MAG: leucine-rich repeat protein [Oscillospiraceae bacterium]|nr:leucine-rich repeat protein [Oscillospiraceae bacterium]